MVILSIHPSRPGTNLRTGEIETSHLHHKIAGSLVFCDKISCRWVKRVPLNEGEKESPPLKRQFSAIGLSSVKMVADKHRYVLLRTNIGNKLLSGVNIDDLE